MTTVDEELDRWVRDTRAEQAKPVPFAEAEAGIAHAIAYANKTHAVSIGVDPRYLRAMVEEIARLTAALDGARREENARCIAAIDAWNAKSGKRLGKTAATVASALAWEIRRPATAGAAR